MLQAVIPMDNWAEKMVFLEKKKKERKEDL